MVLVQLQNPKSATPKAFKNSGRPNRRESKSVKKGPKLTRVPVTVVQARLKVLQKRKLQ